MKNIRVMIDTNVLISAILFPNSQISSLVGKVTNNYTLVLCSHIIDELHIVFERKFKDKLWILEKFLQKLSFELIYTPLEIEIDKFPQIRDNKDLPILVSAIISDIDIIITGDRDFFAVETEKPEILSPRDFNENY